EECPPRDVDPHPADAHERTIARVTALDDDVLDLENPGRDARRNAADMQRAPEVVAAVPFGQFGELAEPAEVDREERDEHGRQDGNDSSQRTPRPPPGQTSARRPGRR